ncbi:MAG: hypothetical protein GY832_10340, partial [Chloroflexi bacterium]|nr:hypothetical protein [Chloroflexota bacterium]
MRERVQLSWETLDEFLKHLRAVSELADCPRPIRELVEAHIQRSGQEDKWSGDELPGIIAKTLLEVWQVQVRGLLEYEGVKQWVIALVPIAQYLERFDPWYEDGLTEYGVSRDGVLCRLRDEKWVKKWVKEEQRVQQIVGQVSKSVQAKAGTYNTWRQKGTEWLRRGIVRALTHRSGEDQAEYMLSLPAHYVERKGALQVLVDQVREAVREGEEMAVVGLAGIGKSTLLAGLVRDDRIRDTFGKRIAVVKVGKEDDALQVLNRTAMALGETLPLGMSGVSGAGKMLRQRLEGERALLVVDDLHRSNALAGVRRLGPKVVVVIATREARVAFAAGIPRRCQVLLEGMEMDEAEEMAMRVAELVRKQIRRNRSDVDGLLEDESNEESEREKAARRDLVRLLEGHPLAVEVAAVGAASMGWEKALEAVKDKRARLELLGYGQEQLNAWASLEAAWEWMEEDLRERLARLGRLPLLNWYDEGVGQAVWGVSAAGAHVVWGKMVHWQLVKQVGKGRYRMHGLVWDFVQKKAEELGMVSRLWTSAWLWRYPLRDVMSRWRWYWPSVPLRRDANKWGWWNIRMPGGTGGKKMMWLAARIEVFWQSGESIHLLASPTEWVVVMRRRRMQRIYMWLMWAGIALLISGLVLTTIAQLPLTWEFWIPVFVALAGALAMVLICFWLFFVTMVDLRRIV